MICSSTFPPKGCQQTLTPTNSWERPAYGGGGGGRTLQRGGRKPLLLLLQGAIIIPRAGDAPETTPWRNDGQHMCYRPTRVPGRLLWIGVRAVRGLGGRGWKTSGVFTGWGISSGHILSLPYTPPPTGLRMVRWYKLNVSINYLLIFAESRWGYCWIWAAYLWAYLYFIIDDLNFTFSSNCLNRDSHYCL